MEPVKGESDNEVDEDNGVFLFLAKTAVVAVPWLAAMGTINWMDKCQSINGTAGPQLITTIIAIGIRLGMEMKYNNGHNN